MAASASPTSAWPASPAASPTSDPARRPTWRRSSSPAATSASGATSSRSAWCSYEIYTGKRAFDATTIAELLRQHDEGVRLSRTIGLHDSKPAVERVILRCLEREPAARPPNALAVSAALPGGDPLAAALAAGETPSPAMVAAAGRKEAVPLRVGLSVVAVVLVGLAVLVGLRGRATFHRYVPAELSGPVLEYRARARPSRGSAIRRRRRTLRFVPCRRRLPRVGAPARQDADPLEGAGVGPDAARSATGIGPARSHSCRSRTAPGRVPSIRPLRSRA